MKCAKQFALTLTVLVFTTANWIVTIASAEEEYREDSTKHVQGVFNAPGTSFFLGCDAGDVLIGLSAYSHTGIHYLRGICEKVLSDHNLGEGYGAGQAGGIPYTRGQAAAPETCPKGWVVTGMAVNYQFTYLAIKEDSSGDLLEDLLALNLVCQKWDPGTVKATDPETYSVLKFTGSGELHYPETGYNFGTCPLGFPMRGIRGSASDVAIVGDILISQLSMICYSGLSEGAKVLQ